MTKRNYQVVLQYTREAGGHEGVRTWTSFEDKTEFEKWYTPKRERKQSIVAQGVSDDKAIELCEQTPLICKIASCVETSTDITGRVHPEILRMKLGGLALANAHSRKDRTEKDRQKQEKNN